MSRRKPYNPNTAYGRKKLRQQSQEYYNNLPDKEKNEFDYSKTIIVVLIIAIALIIGFATGSMNGVLIWLSR